MTAKTMQILRANKAGVYPAEDLLLSESSVKLMLDDEMICEISCTFSHLEELAAGILYDRGYIRGAEEIQVIHIDDKKIEVTRSLEKASKRNAVQKEPPYSFPYEDVLKAYESFSGASELFRKTGGVHSAALLDRQLSPLFMTEDMSRYNVILKIIGYGMKERLSYHDKLLMISSRMPKELTEKCVKAGIVNIASVSAATREAVLFAREHNVQLMGMCRNSRFNIYAWREEGND